MRKRESRHDLQPKAPAMTDQLLCESKGPVTLLTLNRPASRNALTVELITALHQRVNAALSDDNVGAIVITGAPPAFCAGMDLNIVRLSESDPDVTRAAAGALLDLYRAVYLAAKPIIAAVNGHAAAGGACLMTVCDIAIAAGSARVGYPEIRHGVVASVIMPFLVRCVGERRAKYLLLTGEMVPAPVALAAGLVSECVADDACLPRAIELANQLAAYPPGVHEATKRVFAEVQALDPIAGLDAARDLHTDLRLAPGAAQSITRFLNRDTNK